MDDNISVELVARYRAGDKAAAEALFERFAKKLMTIAAARLSARLAQRIDPEDVVHSAYRSFFIKARSDDFVLCRSGDLWNLLVGITVNKLRRQTERHNAGKRAVARERRIDAVDGVGMAGIAFDRDPTPDEAAALADEVENLLRQLEPRERAILEARLQGNSEIEIAAQVGCAERTVRRTMEKTKLLLKKSQEMS